MESTEIATGIHLSNNLVVAMVQRKAFDKKCMIQDL